MPEEKNKTVNTSDISQNINQKESKIKRGSVRTYRDFAVNALKDKPTSLAKMVIEEKKKNEFEYQTSVKNPKNMVVVVLSVVLVVLGVAVVLIMFFYVNKKNNVEIEKEKTVNPQSVIYFDYKEEVLLTKLDRQSTTEVVNEKIKKVNIPIGDVKILYFVKKDADGYKKLINSREFLEILESRAPVQFIKNLSTNMSYGIYSHIESNKPFLVLQFLDVDSIYTNMLAWENIVLSDLGTIFDIDRSFYSQSFSDLNLYNKDARVILNSKGEVVFGYSFIDLNHIVFFTDTVQFQKILNFFQNYSSR